jgi:hypothetical protein
MRRWLYRRLGLTIPAHRTAAGQRRSPRRSRHAQQRPHEFDNHEMARIWHASWRESSDRSRVVLGFSQASRKEVDERYAELTAHGYAARQAPCDAFWGSRYAIVRDPDGNDVGLMSPSDPAKRFTPLVE